MALVRVFQCLRCGYCCGLPQNEEQKALMEPCVHLIIHSDRTTSCPVWPEDAGCRDWPRSPQDLVDGTGWRSPCGYDFIEVADGD